MDDRIPLTLYAMKFYRFEASYPQLDIESPSDRDQKFIAIFFCNQKVESSNQKELDDYLDANIMLVSAHETFKAGFNLEFTIPYRLHYIVRNIWDSSDAILN